MVQILWTLYDYGSVCNFFSVYKVDTCLLGFKEIDGLDKPEFSDRFDLKDRANVYLGEVMGLPFSYVICLGFHLKLKNFGAHLITRVF